jgi:hypothetical protein
MNFHGTCAEGAEDTFTDPVTNETVVVQCQGMMTARTLTRHTHSHTRSLADLNPQPFSLNPLAFRLSPFAFQLSPFNFCLSPLALTLNS